MAASASVRFRLSWASARFACDAATCDSACPTCAAAREASRTASTWPAFDHVADGDADAHEATRRLEADVRIAPRLERAREIDARHPLRGGRVRGVDRLLLRRAPRVHALGGDRLLLAEGLLHADAEEAREAHHDGEADDQADAGAAPGRACTGTAWLRGVRRSIRPSDVPSSFMPRVRAERLRSRAR